MNAVVVAAWRCWATFLLSVAVEARAAQRRTVAPSLAWTMGLQRPVARRLVAIIVLSFGLERAAQDVPSPGGPLLANTVEILEPAAATSAPVITLPLPPPAPSSSGKLCQVQPGDTWS